MHAREGSIREPTHLTLSDNNMFPIRPVSVCIFSDSVPGCMFWYGEGVQSMLSHEYPKRIREEYSSPRILHEMPLGFDIFTEITMPIEMITLYIRDDRIVGYEWLEV